MSSGTITRRDIIEDDALRWGKEYAKTLEQAIAKNQEFVQSIMVLNAENVKLRRSENQTEYLKQKNDLKLITDKTILSLKEQQALEVSLEKVKQESLRTEKKDLELKIKKTKIEKDLSNAGIENEKLNQQKIRTKKEEILVEQQLSKLSIERERLEREGLRTNKALIQSIIEEEKLKKEQLSTLQKQNSLIQQQQSISKNTLDIKSKELRIIAQEEAAKKRNTTLTIEERVQNEANNRVLKQNARDMLGLTTAYEKLNRQRTEAKNRLRDLIVSENASSSAIRKAQKEFDDLDKKVRKADNAVGDFTKDVGKYQNALSGIKNIFLAFGITTGLTLIADISRGIYQTTKELQSLDLALKQVSGTDAEFAQNQQFLIDISEKYGAEIKSLTKTYTQFYVAAKDKLATSEIQDIFESIAKSAGFMGLSVESQERAFLALNQMMSKGTIQAEELKGQLGEALPGAFGIMAKALGVNEKQLGKMLKDGNVLAAEVLPKFAKQLEKTYGIENKNRVENLAAAQARLSNSYVAFVRNISEGDSTLSKFFTITLGYLDQAIRGFTLLTQSRDSYLKGFKDANFNSGIEDVIKEFESLSKLSDEEKLKRAEFFKNSTKETALSIQKESEGFSKRIKELIDERNKAKNFVSISRNNEINNEIDSLNDKIIQNNNLIALSKGRIAGYNEIIQQYYKSSADAQKELTDAEKNELEKRRAEYLKSLQKKLSDEYALLKFRSDRAIELNQLVVDDEEKSIDERVTAFLESEQLKKSAAELTLKKEIVQNALSVIDAKNTSVERMNQIQSEAKLRAQNIINGKINLQNATEEEELIYKRYKKEIEDVDISSARNRQKIIDSQVDIFKKAMDKEVLAKDTALQEELDAENLRYKAELETLKQNNESIEKAVLEHEKKVKQIKIDADKEALDFKIKSIEDILNAEKKKEEGTKLSADKIAEYENQLANLRKQLNELGVEDTAETLQQKEALEKQYNQALIDVSRDIADSLKDIASNIFQSRIDNIDAEIQKNQDYYDKQIELAGNDQRQKDLLQKEADKKRDELEKKKRKEQYNQALINRGFAIAQIAVQTALASITALSPPPTGLGPVLGPSLLPFIIGAGALQTAAVLSAPLPKYEKGTQGKPHKGGYAEVAEKRPEVIIEPNKAPYIIDKHSIVNLEKGTEVISSVDEYKRIQKASYMANLKIGGKNANDALAKKVYEKEYSKEIVNELKLNRKAIEKQNNKNIGVNVNVDINYELWKNNQIYWG